MGSDVYKDVVIQSGGASTLGARGDDERALRRSPRVGAAAGALAGGTAIACTYPLDLARSRIAGCVGRRAARSAPLAVAVVRRSRRVARLSQRTARALRLDRAGERTASPTR